ncbi:MAG TPA: 2'-5' RNA ligase family protein [Amnibacterium sp.]
MPRFVVVLPFSALRPGDAFLRSAWPPHVTVGRNRSGEARHPEVAEALAPIAQMTAPLAVRLDGEAMFGPSADLPVDLVSSTPPLRTLHDRITAAVLRLGGVLEEPHHAGDGFRPHVTRTDGPAPPGEATLRHLVLVSMDPDDVGRLAVRWAGGLTGDDGRGGGPSASARPTSGPRS